MSGAVQRMREMRECLHVNPQLQSYLDGECEAATIERVLAHLEYCRKCGLELAAYREIKRALAIQEQPADDAVARLRTFGERLASGGADARQ